MRLLGRPLPVRNTVEYAEKPHVLLTSGLWPRPNAIFPRAFFARTCPNSRLYVQRFTSIAERPTAAQQPGPLPIPRQGRYIRKL